MPRHEGVGEGEGRGVGVGEGKGVDVGINVSVCEYVSSLFDGAAGHPCSSMPREGEGEGVGMSIDVGVGGYKYLPCLMVQQATLAPACPVVLLSGYPPRPRSSSSM